MKALFINFKSRTKQLEKIKHLNILKRKKILDENRI